MASMQDFLLSRRDNTSAVATEGRYGRWERASGDAAIAYLPVALSGTICPMSKLDTVAQTKLANGRLKIVSSRDVR